MLNPGRRPSVLLIGYGGLGQVIGRAAAAGADFEIAAVLVRPGREAAVACGLPAAQVIHDIAELAVRVDIAVEVAGQAAVAQFGPALLEAGIETAIASTGALADDVLRDRLAKAAVKGRTRLRLLSGAVGGLDLLSAHRQAGLQHVAYTGRKPVSAWKGLATTVSTTDETVVFEGTAREAAQRFPANANVAATIALAGLGLDETRVKLIADPAVQQNVHLIEAESAAGVFRLEMAGWPLPENGSTSALTAYSALRILNAVSQPIVL
jgi:aspartate dehydrogenase